MLSNVFFSLAVNGSVIAAEKKQKSIEFDCFQSAKSPKKQSEVNVFFVNSALKMQCHVVKNTLLQTAFSVILR